MLAYPSTVESSTVPARLSRYCLAYSPSGRLAFAFWDDGSTPLASSSASSTLRSRALALRSVGNVSEVCLNFPVGAPNSSRTGSVLVQLPGGAFPYVRHQDTPSRSRHARTVL